MSALRFVFLVIVSTLAIVSENFSSAQPVASRFLTVMPPGAKIGSAVEVTVTGQDLDDANELRFSNAGISATRSGTNKFNVQVERNMPPGIYDVRVLGRHGISNPRAFAIGTLAEMTLEKPPTRPELAKEVPLNSTVNARAEANAAQYFQVAANKNDRVLARCEAREIDSRFEPVLVALDETGHEIDHNRKGGLLDFTAPSDGRFTIKVHDTIFRGGPEFWYRLSAGTFAHVDFAFPPTVTPGKNKMTVFGRNLPKSKPCKEISLDGKPLEQIEIEIDVPADASARQESLAGVPLAPSQAGVELFAYRCPFAANALLFSVANAPVIFATEPNDAPETAKTISLPCELAGQFDERTNRHWFTFEAKKGETYWIEMVSHRLGLPVDPIVVVQRISGDTATDVLELNDSEVNFGGAEFNTTHRDPYGKFEVKEDGKYRLLVRNLFAPARPDPRLVYHLSIRKAAPDFKLAVLPQALPSKKDAKDILVTSLVARRGETIAVKLFAWRRDGFDGEIAVTALRLPAGVTAAPCRIEGGKNSALMFLTTTQDAASSVGGLVVQGKKTIGSTDVIRSAAPATIVWGTADPANDAAVTRFAASSSMSVAEDMLPVRVHAASNSITTITGKLVKVNFLIDRQASFTGPVKLKPIGITALDSVPEVDVDAKATNLVLQIDLREKKVPVGMHVFALQASAQGKLASEDKKKPKDAAFTFYSEPVVLNVTPAPTTQTNSAAK